MKRIVFEAERSAYSVEQLRSYDVVKVSELIAFLEQFDDDDEVALSHDRGYTYGGVDTDHIEIYKKVEEPEDGEEEWKQVDVYAIWDC